MLGVTARGGGGGGTCTCAPRLNPPLGVVEFFRNIYFFVFVFTKLDR